ncbi:hypothetical protein Bp8pS_115 [Bacillus phage vB_BpuM-BpSp]|nr:hypothetical protein Bp8pS_115 [Bacillus phage vB_BpuM-BpSp]
MRVNNGRNLINNSYKISNYFICQFGNLYKPLWSEGIYLDQITENKFFPFGYEIKKEYQKCIIENCTQIDCIERINNLLNSKRKEFLKKGIVSIQLDYISEQIREKSKDKQISFVLTLIYEANRNNKYYVELKKQMTKYKLERL